MNAIESTSFDAYLVLIGKVLFFGCTTCLLDLFLSCALRLFLTWSISWLSLSITKHTERVQVLLRALRDFNLGKLTADDEGIFMGLLNDLFPGTAAQVPRAVDANFETKVTILSPHPISCLCMRAGAGALSATKRTLSCLRCLVRPRDGSM